MDIKSCVLSRVYRGWLTVLALALFVALASSFASACMCSVPEICGGLFSRNAAAAVFVGTVKSIDTGSTKEFIQFFKTHKEIPWYDRYRAFSSYVRVAFDVQESFRGVLGNKVSVRTINFTGACGYEFKKGEQYLVWASLYEGEFHTGLCSRTRPLANTEVDYEIGLLRKLRGQHGTSMIFGYYGSGGWFSSGRYGATEVPRSGETITLKSEEGYTTKAIVDKHGHFLLSGLPPSTYELQASTPPHYRITLAGNRRQGIDAGSVPVAANRCAEITFGAEPDGHITGRVVDAKGSPIQSAVVRAWSVGTAPDIDTFDPTEAKTDKGGNFYIGRLYPGTYTLGAYVYALPQGFPVSYEDRQRLNHATLRFSGGNAELSSAKRIDVKLGEHISGVRIVIPFDPSAWKDVTVY